MTDSVLLFGMSSDAVAGLIGGFGGAVVGAVVGGGISWLLAKQASAESAKRDANARDEDLKARAMKLMIKCSLVLTDVSNDAIRAHVVGLAENDALQFIDRYNVEYNAYALGRMERAARLPDVAELPAMNAELVMGLLVLAVAIAALAVVVGMIFNLL